MWALGRLVCLTARRCDELHGNHEAANVWHEIGNQVCGGELCLQGLWFRGFRVSLLTFSLCSVQCPATSHTLFHIPHAGRQPSVRIQHCVFILVSGSCSAPGGHIALVHVVVLAHSSTPILPCHSCSHTSWCPHDVLC